MCEGQNEKILDLSIVRANIDASLATDKRRFYRLALIDENMALVPRKAPTSVHVETQICLDHNVFSEKIAEKHKQDKEDEKAPTYNRPVELDDQVVECTPQFILRNIPKIEHYYDLDRALPFNEEDLPLNDALAAIESARKAHLDPVDLPDLRSAEVINDFRVFLEEIFYLCPWDCITRRPPTEDSPWHPKHSHAKLAQYLLDAQNTLFIFSDKGTTQIGTTAFVPAEKSDVPQGFQSFGPLS